MLLLYLSLLPALSTFNVSFSTFAQCGFYSLTNSPKKLHHRFQVQEKPLPAKTLPSSLLSGQMQVAKSIAVFTGCLQSYFEQIQCIYKVAVVSTLRFSTFREFIRQKSLHSTSLNLYDKLVYSYIKFMLHYTVTFQHFIFQNYFNK